MSAIIELPNGIRASVNDAGEWQCDIPATLMVIRGIAAGVGARSYLPDPYEDQRAAVVEVYGARIIELRIKETPGTGADSPQPIH